MLHQCDDCISSPIWKQDEARVVDGDPFTPLVLVGSAGLVADAGLGVSQRSGEALLSGLATEQSLADEIRIHGVDGQRAVREPVHEAGYR